jgi:O-antigen ligase
MNGGFATPMRFRWLATLGAAVAGGLFLSHWPIYQNLVLDGPIPLVYYATLAIPVSLLLLVRPDMLIRALREPIALWFVLYVASGLLWLLLAGQFYDLAAKLSRGRLLASLIFLACLMLTREGNRPRLAILIAGCVILASVNNWLDLLTPFGLVFHATGLGSVGRGAGLFVNANQAGAAVIAMGIGVMPLLSMRHRGALAALVMLGVYPTFSRSAFMCAALVVLGAAGLGQLKKKHIVLAAAVLATLLAVGGAVLERGTTLRDMDIRNVQDRLLLFVSGADAVEDSARLRTHIAALAWRMFADNPIVGNGIGATLVELPDLGAHNMYLTLAAEQGLGGAALYLSFLFIIVFKGARLFRHGRSRPDRDLGAGLILMGAYFTCLGWFSHNLLEDPVALFILAFLVAGERAAVSSVGARAAHPLRDSSGWLDESGGSGAVGTSTR